MANGKFNQTEYESKKAAKEAAKAAVKKSANVKDVADRVDTIEGILGIQS